MKKQYTIPHYGTFTVDDERQLKFARSFTDHKHPQEDELKIFERFVDAGGGVFLDIGANIGTITVAMAKVAKEVYAFEPVEENVALLEENVRLNNLTNVKVFPVALGSENGSVRLETSGDTVSSSIRGDGDIKLVPLDSIATEPSFIKMDVEGYELQVLKGARATIKKYQPVIFFEMNLIETRKRNDWWLRNVSRELKAQGYTLYLPTINGQTKVRSMAWTMFRLAPKAFLTGRLHFSVNFLALPTSK